MAIARKMTAHERLIFTIGILAGTAVYFSAIWLAYKLIIFLYGHPPLGQLLALLVILAIIPFSMWMYGVWGFVAFWVMHRLDPTITIPWHFGGE